MGRPSEMVRPSSTIRTGLRILGLSLLVQASAVCPGAAEGIKDHERVQEALTLLQVWLEAKRDYGDVPGLSAAVVHNQELLWSGGYGMADPGRGIAATADSIYGICSISKLFTSIAVMRLRDAGKLRLDDPVSELLPAYGVTQAYEGSAEVTVEGLLTHSSGLHAQVDAPYSTGPDFRFPTREEMMRLQAGQETLYPAATYFAYSNLGMALAGEIVAELSGMSFEDYIQENILDPLDLESTWTRLPEEEVGKRMAVGYSARRRDGTRSELRLYQARGLTPALGLASTVRDLAAFASWQFRLLESGNDEILAANTLKEMYRPHFMLPGWEMAKGLGFHIQNQDGKIYVGHGGICAGFVTQLMLEPRGRVAVVVMANANKVDIWNLSAMMHEIMGPAIEAAANSNIAGMTGDGTEAAQMVENEDVTDFSDYTGLYDASPWNADTAFIVWEGKLAALRLSSNSPVQELRYWKHIEGDVFRRIRSDGVLAETWRFERDPSGNVERVKVYGDYLPKIR